MDRVTARPWLSRAAPLAVLALLVPLALRSAEGLAWHGRALGIGFVGGFAGGMVAGAIGLIAIPLIVIGLGLPLHQAAATNLVQTAATAGVGAWRHHGKRLVDWRNAGIVLAGSLAGAPLGSWMALQIRADALAYVFVAALLAAAASMAWRAYRPKAKPPTVAECPVRRTCAAKGVALGVGLGFASGLLGVGAGFLVTPSLAGVLGLPIHAAIGTGLAVIAGNSALASVPHVAIGEVHWLAAGFLAVGGAVGVRIGGHVGRRTDERWLRVGMGIVLLAAAWSLLP